MKAYIADISDASNRGFSFSIIAIGWGAGSILGATFGGLLVKSYELEDEGEPHIPSESVLQWWIFKEYAYLLPCVVGCIMAINAIIWTLLFVKNEAGSYASLKEANKSKSKGKNNGNDTKWSMSRNDSMSKKYSHHELKSIDYNSSGYLSKSLPSVAKANDVDDLSRSQYSADDSFYGNGKRRGNTRNYSLLQYEEAAYTIEGTLNDTLNLKDLLSFNTNDKKPLLHNGQKDDDDGDDEIEINSLRDLFTKTYLARTMIVIMAYAMFSMVCCI